MDGLSSSLAVLTAMITPAVLISASGTMILSTSTRLGRVVDRVRSLSDRLQELAGGKSSDEFAEERRVMLYDQLDKLTSRSRLLQRALTTFYLAVGIIAKKIASPRKRATAGARNSIFYPSDCSAARSAGYEFVGYRVWGFASLHPRLYAFACSAGWCFFFCK